MLQACSRHIVARAREGLQSRLLGRQRLRDYNLTL